MLEFINWLIETHPEIQSIKGLSTERLLQLADQFDFTRRKLADDNVEQSPDRMTHWTDGLKLLIGDIGVDTGFYWKYEEAQELAIELSQRVNETRTGGYHLEPTLSRRGDPVRRYRSVPLHGMFMYSSEDVEFSQYIRSNWRALDRMSSDFCDMYASIDQLVGLEDVYSLLNSTTELVRGMCAVKLSHLPGIIFWDKQEKGEYISFAGRNDAVAIRDGLRIIFYHIRQQALMKSITEARAELQDLDQQRDESRNYNVTVIDSRGIQIGNSGHQTNAFTLRSAKQKSLWGRLTRKKKHPPVES